jgi:hypothetical protein
VEFRQAHITILPPRQLRVPVEVASEFTQKVLRGFRAFEVELCSVRLFPNTNVFYLDLAKGNDTIHRLHDALNTGDLKYEEQFEFHPHLTLGGPVPEENVASVQARAENLWRSIERNRRFLVSDLVALWAEPGRNTTGWRRLWSHPLVMEHAAAHAGLIGQRS